MGMQKKHGKGRLDKWYKLAKEKGYRARAAFKLIQINRKYAFLEKSKVLLDLCAAPGSWCQVAAETMPASSLIVGVDLSPIKPIPRTTTFQSDITTDKCRATIRQHLKSWKADTVLHDGAPNVGTAWVQDAFSQAELVLQSLKLATEFLSEGGTYVTKVFRSKDYNALLWVFNQLFSKVDATKPPSSRNVSAEIFVVCRDFKAAKKIDPKFLDPRSVFAELSDPTPNNEAKVFNPEIKKRKRDGYEEGDYTQFKVATAIDFIHTTDPIAILGSLNRLVFEQPGNGDLALVALDKLPDTTNEIKQCCSDLKVLGRKDFKLLLRWRLKARSIFGLAAKNKLEAADADMVVQTTSMDHELQIQEEMDKLYEIETSKKKRGRRRYNEKKQREIVRMQLHMTTPTDIGLEQEGPNDGGSMFGLTAIERAGASDKFAKGKMAIQVRPEEHNATDIGSEESDEEEDALDTELDGLYSQYQKRKSESDAKHRARTLRKEHDDGEWHGFSDDEASCEDEFERDEDSEDSSSDDPIGEDILNDSRPSQQHIWRDQNSLTLKAASYFQQDIFKDVGVLDAMEDRDSAVDLDADDNNSADDYVAVATSKPQRDLATSSGCGAVETLIQINDHKAMEHSAAAVSIEKPSIADGTFEVVKTPNAKQIAEGVPNLAGRQDIDIITAEAMTLAQELASGSRTTHDIADDGFNKFTFRDNDGLPEWFLDDEGKHSRPHRPISAAGAAAIKEKLRALNARPIKKVREAKDRKKFKAAQRLEKLRRKSAIVADDEAISEKDKAQNIARMMSKAAKKKPKQQVKLVVAKGGNKGISGRPKGIKGKYKIVDARLKKDVRAEKRLAKKQR